MLALLLQTPHLWGQKHYSKMYSLWGKKIIIQIVKFCLKYPTLVTCELFQILWETWLKTKLIWSHRTLKSQNLAKRRKNNNCKRHIRQMRNNRSSSQKVWTIPWIWRRSSNSAVRLRSISKLKMSAVKTTLKLPLQKIQNKLIMAARWFKVREITQRKTTNWQSRAQNF